MRECAQMAQKAHTCRVGLRLLKDDERQVCAEAHPGLVAAGGARRSQGCKPALERVHRLVATCDAFPYNP